MPGTGFFERQFRAQFTPHDGGYSLNDAGSDYWFDAEEVEQFVVEWRRHWANPLVWAAYLALGVALPAWLYYEDFWGATLVIGIVAGIAMVVNLIFPLRQPYELAAARAPLKQKAAWQPPTGPKVLLGFGMAAALGSVAWFFHKPEHPWFSSSDIFPVFLALHMLWMAMVDFVLWRRAKGISLKPYSEEKAQELRTRGIYFALSIISIILWVSPQSDWWERVFSVGVLIVIAASDIWKQISAKRDAEAHAG